VLTGRRIVIQLDCATISGSNRAAISGLRRTPMMKRIFLAAIVATFAAGSAFAQETCESKAVGKDGKPLAGAAKTSFMKKCKQEACTPKAVGSDGKPLAGAAKNSFMKKCETSA
jgi:hypothetical protein